MILYLTDTDWIIDYLKGKKEIVDKLISLVDEGLTVSIISLAELYYYNPSMKNQGLRGKGRVSGLTKRTGVHNTVLIPSNWQYKRNIADMKELDAMVRSKNYYRRY